ncbi:hypothetical protein EL84_29205 [Paenibacillus sp. VT-400]|nr:hypothetical protein EL84_29205 [Paenibacillus sp. VT-400]
MNMGRKLITTVLTIICFTLAASLISMNESYSFDFYILIYPNIRDSLDPVDRATFIDIARLSAQPHTIP